MGTASNRTARPPTRLGLLNCPFHHLAARSPELACGINHAFVCGNLDGLEATGVDAVLAPHPGQCCVELREPRTDAAEPPAGEGCARDHGGASPR